MRLQSQGAQDLRTAAAPEHLIFKTSPEEQTVDLTNKGMTMDSQRFSRWFHSAWRTTLTCSCRWMHEGADLRSYMGGCVRSGTSHQKHKAACFARAFSALTDMRSERHSHFAYCSWLSSNNDAFARISLFLVPRAARGTAFSHTLKHMPDLFVIETRILVH